MTLLFLQHYTISIFVFVVCCQFVYFEMQIFYTFYKDFSGRLHKIMRVHATHIIIVHTDIVYSMMYFYCILKYCLEHLYKIFFIYIQPKCKIYI